MHPWACLSFSLCSAGVSMSVSDTALSWSPTFSSSSAAIPQWLPSLALPLRPREVQARLEAHMPTSVYLADTDCVLAVIAAFPAAPTQYILNFPRNPPPIALITNQTWVSPSPSLSLSLHWLL